MRVLALFPALVAALVSLRGPASAITGQAGPAYGSIDRFTVFVRSPKGGCSGVVLAQDLVMTAAHCLEPKGGGIPVEGFVSEVRVHGESVAEVVPHPDFRKAERFVGDIALVKLKQPLPAGFVPALLQARTVKEGDRVIVGGFGTADQKDQYATLRSGVLVVVSTYIGMFYIRDVPHGGPRLAACHGDSGGPVFTYRGLIALVGIMVGGEGDCTGTTRVVPVSQHHEWITETAEKLGSPLK
jgi:V8-like Glu-specific endopeptidase